MPSFMVSCIWCARNSSIFNDKDIPLEVTTGIILNLPKEFLIDIEIKDPRVSVMLELDFGIPWGFFDGACQGHPPVCGVGVFLCINHNHYIHVCYAPERGTNDRAEFIALRTLLEIASIKDVKKLQIMGDSKLVIDWARKKATISDVRLEPLLRDIKHSMKSFEWFPSTTSLENSMRKQTLYQRRPSPF